MAKRTKYILIDGVEHFWFNWCTGYYTREFCKNKIKEFKSDGKYADARIGSSVKDSDGRWYRVQVLVPTK